MNEWLTYTTELDGILAEVQVDASLVGVAGDDGRAVRVWLRVKVPGMRSKRGPDGHLCDATLRDKLRDTGEAIADGLSTDDVEAVFAGAVCVEGGCDFVVYAAVETGALDTAKRIASEAGFEAIDARIARDPEWALFAEVLMPSAREWLLILNRTAIEAEPDAGPRRRLVHDGHFPSKRKRTGFSDAAKSIGFTEVEAFAVEAGGDDDEDNPNPYGVRIARDDDWALVHLDALTNELHDLAREHDGHYDGWKPA